MKVAKWGNSLAIRIPVHVVAALGLKEGDEVDIKGNSAEGLTVERVVSREAALARIRRLARPLPDGWAFDRDEANAR